MTLSSSSTMPRSSGQYGGHHSYYFGGGGHRAMEDGEIGHGEQLRETPSDRDESDRSEFSDMESLDEESNQGY